MLLLLPSTFNKGGMFLAIPLNRTSLASSGLRPQQYSTEEMELMDMSVIYPSTPLYRAS